MFHTRTTELVLVLYSFTRIHVKFVIPLRKSLGISISSQKIKSLDIEENVKRTFVSGASVRFNTVALFVRIKLIFN